MIAARCGQEEDEEKEAESWEFVRPQAFTEKFAPKIDWGESANWS
jgi:hypothetical protein